MSLGAATDPAPVTAEAVLDFWFGAPPLAARPAWFAKSTEFDAEIARRFAETHAALRVGELSHWRTTPRGALATILVLDQFSRNMYRDRPEAFSGDRLALATAEDVVWRQWDRDLHPLERQFVYLPFEHAEDAGLQARSLALFAQLEAFDVTRGLLEWAERHAAVIARFGRFPHRNAILGRLSSPEELAFLREPGSRF